MRSSADVKSIIMRNGCKMYGAPALSVMPAWASAAITIALSNVLISSRLSNRTGSALLHRAPNAGAGHSWEEFRIGWSKRRLDIILSRSVGAADLIGGTG